MTMSSSETRTDHSIASQLRVVELKPGLKFSEATLKDLLPDVQTALFFGKVYELDHSQLSNLLRIVLPNTPLKQALLNEGHAHSVDLQGYVLDLCTFVPESTKIAKRLDFKADVPKGEILPELWKSLEIEVAGSIAKVAEKLHSVVGHMPGKQGQMLFKSMMVMNARRPTIGDHKAYVHHAPQKENLVILDDSSSVSRSTVQTLVDDVVALAYMANAHFALVSNTARHWEPGSYGTDDVLAQVENGGTHYEQLKSLLNRDWGVVVTIADYDSSYAAEGAIDQATGHIDEVLDISLVDRPTYLAQVVGRKADRTRPLLVATHNLCHAPMGW